MTNLENILSLDMQNYLWWAWQCPDIIGFHNNRLTKYSLLWSNNYVNSALVSNLDMWVRIMITALLVESCYFYRTLQLSWWKWEIVCLASEYNPYLLHSRPVCETLQHLGSLMSPLYPHLPVYATSCLRAQYRLLHSSPWNCKSFNTYKYMHADSHFTYIYIYIYKVGSTTIQHVACTGSWLQHQSRGCDKNRKYCA